MIFKRTAALLVALGAIATWGSFAEAQINGFNSFAPANMSGAKHTGYNSDRTTFTLTDGHPEQATSGFGSHKQAISAFRAAFTYTAHDLHNGGGDGIAFVLQNSRQGTRALGYNGGSLGYGGRKDITHGIAFEINIYPAAAPDPAVSLGIKDGITVGTLPPSDCIGIQVAGGGNTGEYISTPGVNLADGHPVRVELSYNGITLRQKLTDEITGKIFRAATKIDIPWRVGGRSAYVGFTGGSGAASARQAVTDFSFTPLPPATHPLKSESPVNLVDPFLGTGTGPGGSENLFPGACVPFGMVQLSPDTESSGFGYHYYQPFIQGFSMTHMSGPGCNNEGDVFFTATTGPVHTQVQNFQSAYSHSLEAAKPGFYGVRLLRWNIATRLTAANRAGVAQFTFPAGKAANILLPISHTLNTTHQAHLDIVNNHEVTGYVVDQDFCGAAPRYHVYFVMTFNHPFHTFGTWTGNRQTAGSRTVTQLHQRGWVGGWLTWPTATHKRTITMRIGISYVDLRGAENNLRHSVASKSFSAVYHKAMHKWIKALNVIHVHGGTPGEKIVFYTSLYHSLLMPSMFSDADGRYIGFDDRIHHIAAGHNVYCNYSGWDIYRSEFPLLCLVAPQRVEDMCESIDLMYRQGGWIDRWPQIHGYTNVMCGSPLTTCAATAWMDGLHGFDMTNLWQGMVKDATQAPPPGKPYGGESNINWINKIHFDPNNHEGYGSVSQLQEDCVAYASMHYLAQALDKARAAAMFKARALYFRNVFDHQDRFFRPRNSNRAWVHPFNPSQQWHGFIEGSGWHYQWLAPQDMAWLVHAVGTSRFNRRLQAFFSYRQAGWYGQYYNPYNETDLEAPFEFNFSGKPWRTQWAVRKVLRQNYTLSSNGVPGNDDCGEMSSWAVLSMMGIYSVDPASTAYEICSPVFRKITLHLAAPYSGGKFVISGSKNPIDNSYIQSVTVNGAPLNKCWIPVSTITHGGDMAFKLGHAPNRSWATAPADRPPSLTPYH